MCLLPLNFPHVHTYNVCIEMPGHSYDLAHSKVAHTPRHPKRDTILLFLFLNNDKKKIKPTKARHSEMEEKEKVEVEAAAEAETEKYL